MSYLYRNTIIPINKTCRYNMWFKTTFSQSSIFNYLLISHYPIVMMKNIFQKLIQIPVHFLAGRSTLYLGIS